MGSLPDMVFGVWSDFEPLQIAAASQIEMLLSTENAPIQEVVASGVVSRFVEFLGRDDSPSLQWEALRVLIKIASGTPEQARVVIEHGAIPIFVKLINSPADYVSERAVWGLGVVSVKSPQICELALNHGALTSLIFQLNMHHKISMLRIMAWTLSVFCITLDLEQTQNLALPAIKRLIHSTDEEVLSNACFALYNISVSTYEKTRAVIEAKFCERLVELLWNPSFLVVTNALGAVNAIICGGDIHAQCIINPQLLFCLSHLITQNHDAKVTEFACLTIANITGENQEQVQAVISAGIISPLLHLLQTSEFVIKKEAAIAILNAIANSSSQQIKYLVSQGCIRELCGLLVSPDLQTVRLCLEGLEIILKAGKTEKIGDKNLYTQLITNEFGMLEKMQSHDNREISEKAVNILETYWSNKDVHAAQVENNMIKVKLT